MIRLRFVHTYRLKTKPGPKYDETWRYEREFLVPSIYPNMVIRDKNGNQFNCRDMFWQDSDNQANGHFACLSFSDVGSPPNDMTSFNRFMESKGYLLTEHWKAE